jgi:competence protein ComEC
MTLITLGLAWLAGIALARWLEPPLPTLGLLALPPLAALFLWRREPGPRLAAACALALLAGGVRLLGATPHFGPGDLATYNDQGQVTLVGVVVDEPDVRDTYQNLRLRAESLTLESVGAEGAGARPAPTDSGPAPDTRAVRGLVLVQAPRYPAHAYGERLAVSGELETPPVFEDFSYKDYLARQGVYSMLHRPRIELVEASQGNPLWAGLYTFKARGQGTIAQILPEPYAALLSGILLGVETGIPQNLYEQFNTTGTSHIIVISGFNIAIVAGLLMLAGSKAVGKRRAVPLALAGIVLYTLLVGADAAVVRAAIMGCLYVLALYFGRQAEVRTSLIFSALLMTAINPYTLWDVGFQLSFAATAGLIWVAPPLERVAERWLTALVGAQHVRRVMGLLSEALLVTLAAQIATEPLIMYHFGRMSAVSLLTNLLILPVQPMVMLAGGLATMAGMVSLPLGQLLGWLAWLPLAWTVWVVGWTATVPFASLSLGRFSPWLLAAIYAGLVGGLWLASHSRSDAEAQPPPSPSPNRLRGSTRAMFAGGALAVALIWLAAASLPDGRLHVAFLDVGQGDAIFITTPSGRQILIDGGPGPSDVLWGMGRHMPFWDRSLDVVVNTHPDADHLAGLPEVLGRYQVGQILLPDVENDTPLYAAWQEAMAAEGASVTQAQAGMRLSLEDGVQVEVLHPGAVPASERFNDHSVVLRVTLGEISFLLPGDIEAGVEQGLVARNPSLVATVLKAPHHGGDTSSSRAFLKAVDPQVAVISVGADNRFGHPAPQVLARYAEQGVPALRTDELGTVEFVTDGERLWVETAH